MKRRIPLAILFLTILICAGSARAESIAFEEAYRLAQHFNEKSAAQLPEEGWFFYRSVFRAPERHDGFVSPDSETETWYYFNDAGAAERRLDYRIGRGGERELISANPGNFSLQIEEKILIEGVAPDKPWFDLGFEFFLGNILPGSGKTEIDIRADLIQDQALYLAEAKFVADRTHAELLGFADDFGSLRRVWFDPATGFALRSELYDLAEDGSLGFSGSVADVSYGQVSALPDEVRRDYERVRDRNAAEWRDFTVIEN